MLYAAISIAILILIAIAFQVFYVQVYHRDLVLSQALLTTNRSDQLEHLPRVAVILCLRGFDPTLKNCLLGLSCQNYSNYQLNIVVDDWDDPGCHFAREFSQANQLDVVFHKFDVDFARGSLKCRGMVHAIRNATQDIEIFAFIDADIAPDPNWLLDLVQPLVESPDVHATTGNRWFHPTEKNLGSLVRKIWNAAAIVQMSLYNIAWGGTLAIKRQAIDDTDLLSKWEVAFCEDTMLKEVFKKNGLTVKRVPHLILESHESSSLSGTFLWITRQLFNARLYHQLWPLIFGHAFLVLLCLTVPVLIVAFSLILPDTQALAIASFSFVLLQFANVYLVRKIERDNVDILNARQAHKTSISPESIFSTLFAVLVNQAVYPLAAIRAQIGRQMLWRGIQYRVVEANSVEMLKYQPLGDGDAAQQPNSTSESIH